MIAAQWTKSDGDLIAGEDSSLREFTGKQNARILVHRELKVLRAGTH